MDPGGGDLGKVCTITLLLQVGEEAAWGRLMWMVRKGVLTNVGG